MLKWLFNLFSRFRRNSLKSNIRVETNDPYVERMVLEAWDSGADFCTGSVLENGNLEVIYHLEHNATRIETFDITDVKTKNTNEGTSC